MADFLNIEYDIKEAVEAVGAPEKNYKGIRKRILKGVGTSVRKAIRKNYGAFLHKGSGNLYKFISGSRSFISNQRAIVVAPKARASNQQFYGYALAKGALITSRGDNLLTFKIGDKWIRKYAVKLPERNWFNGPGLDYLQSSAYRERLEQLIEREVIRYEKQLAKERSK